jgi:hypothetical protein
VGCKLILFDGPAPKLPAWDDLGVAEVGCHIDTPGPTCKQRLRAEACRMGGDVIYNMPKKALRPSDQVIVLRAQVAHTRGNVKEANAEPPPPSDADAGAAPIEPLPHATPAPGATDAGGGFGGG